MLVNKGGIFKLRIVRGGRGIGDKLWGAMFVVSWVVKVFGGLYRIGGVGRGNGVVGAQVVIFTCRLVVLSAQC